MDTHAAPQGARGVSRRLERLATPLVASRVPAWLYCRVEDRLPDGDLVCSVVDAQWWPSLMIDGIIPGVRYAVRADRVLSIIRAHAPADGD